MDTFFLIIAMGLIFLGIWLFFEKMSCTKVVEGIFVGNQTLHSGRSQICTPIFRYEVDSVSYEGQALEAYSGRQSREKYKEGDICTLFVNQKKPYRFVLGRKVRIDDVSLILAGVMFAIFLFI